MRRCLGITCKDKLPGPRSPGDPPRVIDPETNEIALDVDFGEGMSNAINVAFLRRVTEIVHLATQVSPQIR
jgi:hypothetical protein